MKEVARVADEINRDLSGTNPLFISVLNGSFMFTADLMKHLTMPCEVSFVKLASYEGTSSTGKVKELVGLGDDITGRTVVIVEDIVDTGTTLKYLLEKLNERHPKTLKVCTMLDKPSRRTADFHADYIGFQVEDLFIIGYGLDYDQKYRNLPYISYLQNEGK